jgi:hypothetical protein
MFIWKSVKLAWQSLAWTMAYCSFFLSDSSELALKAARAALSGGITVVSLIFRCKLFFYLIVGMDDLVYVMSS